MKRIVTPALPSMGTGEAFVCGDWLAVHQGPQSVALARMDPHEGVEVLSEVPDEMPLYARLQLRLITQEEFDAAQPLEPMRRAQVRLSQAQLAVVRAQARVREAQAELEAAQACRPA